MRLRALEQLWIDMEDPQRRIAKFLATVRAALALEGHSPDVDDFSRNELAEVLADAGLAREEATVAGQSKNPFARGRAEAVAAQGLALCDRDAGISLLQRALRAREPKAPAPMSPTTGWTSTPPALPPR